ncbi:methyltransferase type 12 family protein [Pasteurella multocida]|nr:methyltransferase type 12 family protein [Pasteurella multocida]
MEKLDLLKQSYNELPYVSKGFSHTLPERQRAVLSLLGFHTPHIEHAKVLEIGCGFWWEYYFQCVNSSERAFCWCGFIGNTNRGRQSNR